MKFNKKNRRVLSIVGIVVALLVLGGVAYLVSTGGFSQLQSQAGLARSAGLREWTFTKGLMSWRLPGANSGRVDRKQDFLYINNIKKLPVILTNNSSAVRITVSGPTTLNISLTYATDATRQDSLIRTPPAGLDAPTAVIPSKVSITEPLVVTAKYIDSMKNEVTLGTKEVTSSDVANGKFVDLSFDFPTGPTPLPTGLGTTQNVKPSQTSFVTKVSIRALTFEFTTKGALPESISVSKISLIQVLDTLKPTGGPNLPSRTGQSISTPVK